MTSHFHCRIAPLDLALKPTPVTVIEGLVPQVRIHVKRDDLTGCVCSGNKIRKLEFLLADARSQGADLVITCGPVQSNHVRATAAACDRLGLKAVAVLRGEPESVPDGNFLLDSLLAADCRFITADEYKRVDAVMVDVAQEYKRRGFRPYVIPEGGSNGIGALGYVQVVAEMAGYIAANNIDAIFCAVGSGGTYAGLWVGKRIQGIETQLQGILVADDIPFFRQKVSRIISEMEPVLDRKLPVSPDEFAFSDQYIEPRYARLYPEAVETIGRVARFGVVLDPVYTAKAFHGMLAELNRLRCRNPLFIHTGGVFSLFSYRHELFTRADAGT